MMIGSEKRWRVTLASLLLAVAALLPGSVLAQAVSDGSVADTQARVVILATGGKHACALRAGGFAVCWGDNTYDQLSAPNRATRLVALTAGANHTCGLRSNGKVICWGDNSFGQNNAPGPPKFIVLAAGERHTCGMRAGGTVQCWGSNASGQTSVPNGESFMTVVAGGSHTCGLHRDGSAGCWGSNASGQSAAPSGVTFTALAAGANHTCGLRADGSVQCWGDNGAGQATPPVATDFISITASANQSCGVHADGSATCWGDNGSGQGDVPAGDVFTSLAAGGTSTCGVRSTGTVECWGSNSNGQTNTPTGVFGFGNIATGGQHSCQRVPGGVVVCWGSDNFGQLEVPAGKFSTVASGGRHSCALSGTDNSVTCWGDNAQGQVSPVQVGPGHELVLGEANSCFLGTDGLPACWGWNVNGQSTVPVPPAGRTYRIIEPGFAHACGVLDDNSGLCWGYDGDGETDLPVGTTWQAITTGGFHSCGIRTSGTVTCWGRNTENQLAAPGGTFRAISAGDYHTCGIKDDGTLACWGLNDHGQSTPPAGNYVSISAGGNRSCAVRLDGASVCWGDTSTSPVSLQPAFLPGVNPGVAYSQQITMVGMGSYVPLNPAFAISAGNLPAGITLGTDGLLSGITAAAPGNYAITIEAIDDNGFVATRDYVLVVSNDTTPPDIVPTVTGTLGNEGWYTSDVQISWGVTDTGSSIIGTIGCDPVTLSSDAMAADFTCTATSGGGTNSITVPGIKRDANGPGVTATPSPVANAAGWNNGDVTVSFTCNDGFSGVASCPTDQVLTSEGVSVQSAAAVATDAAGNNSAAPVVTVKIDRTAPTLAPSVTPDPLLLNSTATASANGSDALSGIASESCAALATATVGSKTVNCTVTDAAGNSASAGANYRVVYGFIGFRAPIVDPNAWYTAPAGRSVGFDWRVVDANNAPVTNLKVAVISDQQVACPAPAAVTATPRNPGMNTMLQNLGNGRYHKDWIIPTRLKNTCHVLTLNMGDGVPHTAKFWFK